MNEQPNVDEHDWPTHCPICNTELESAMTGFNPAGDDDVNHHERAEVVAVDFCPNPDCPGKNESARKGRPA